MSTAGAALIEKIRAKAKQTGGTSVFALAQIPVPATPTSVGPPGKPYECVVELNEDGSITSKWKCSNPVGCTGVVYQLWRKIGTGEFEYIGGTGSKTFVDSTIPAGSSSITYQMQGV